MNVTIIVVLMYSCIQFVLYDRTTLAHVAVIMKWSIEDADQIKGAFSQNYGINPCTVLSISTAVT